MAGCSSDSSLLARQAGSLGLVPWYLIDQSCQLSNWKEEAGGLEFKATLHYKEMKANLGSGILCQMN